MAPAGSLTLNKILKTMTMVNPTSIDMDRYFKPLNPTLIVSRGQNNKVLGR